MITTRSRRNCKSRGSAVMPSSSGISTSSTTTSGFRRGSSRNASTPLRRLATTSKSGSAAIQRENIPRTTMASSTIITRRRARTASAVGNGTAMFMKRTRSDQADLLKFGFDDVAVEGLHDVFVGARVQRPRDMRYVVFRRAEDDLRPVATRQLAQGAQEFVAVHL